MSLRRSLLNLVSKHAAGKAPTSRYLVELLIHHPDGAVDIVWCEMLAPGRGRAGKLVAGSRSRDASLFRVIQLRFRAVRTWTTRNNPGRSTPHGSRQSGPMIRRRWRTAPAVRVLDTSADVGAQPPGESPSIFGRVLKSVFWNRERAPRMIEISAVTPIRCNVRLWNRFGADRRCGLFRNAVIQSKGDWQ